jgi:hypothetical protein
MNILKILICIDELIQSLMTSYYDTWEPNVSDLKHGLIHRQKSQKHFGSLRSLDWYAVLCEGREALDAKYDTIDMYESWLIRAFTYITPLQLM